MNRRGLLRAVRSLAGVSVLAPSLSTIGRTLAAERAATPKTSVPMHRLGATSVCFRERFHATRDPNNPLPAKNPLNLEMFPGYLADEFGLRNVEVWSAHFDDLSLAYCERLRKAAAAVQAKVINIQLDGAYDISSPDGAERERSIAFVKGWIDRAAACGASLMRANADLPGPDGKPTKPFNLSVTADSYRRLAEYAERRGVEVLVENHIGFTVDIDKVVAIVEAVNSPWCRSLSDWGNTPAATLQERIALLAKMFPTLALVSAKGLHFDAAYRHLDYDIGEITRATERSGFGGVYSIELYTRDNPPADPALAVRSMIRDISAALSA